MNPLTADRYAVAGEVATLLGWTLATDDGPTDPTAPGTVYPNLPASVVTPCAVVVTDGDLVTMVGHGPTYLVPVTVLLFADALDLVGLEDAWWEVLLAAGNPGTVASPGAVTFAGSVYLGASVTLNRHVAAT